MKPNNKIGLTTAWILPLLNLSKFFLKTHFMLVL